MKKIITKLLGCFIFFVGQLILLLCASFPATFVTSAVFFFLVFFFQPTSDHYQLSYYFIPLLYFTVAGHLYASPSLFLAYFPLSLILWKKRSPYFVFLFLATLLATINGVVLVLMLRGGTGVWLFLLVFSGSGFLTGVFHYLILNNIAKTRLLRRM